MSNHTFLLSNISVRMCCSHTPATFCRLKSRFDQHWEMSCDFTFRVSHICGQFSFCFLNPAGFCIILLTLLLFQSQRERQEQKLDKRNKKTWDSCWNQTPGLLCVYTASLRHYLAVCNTLPVFPPSVRSHDLVTDTGLWSIVYLNKLDSPTAEWETDWDQTRAEWSVWSPPTVLDN